MNIFFTFMKIGAFLTPMICVSRNFVSGSYEFNAKYFFSSQEVRDTIVCS